MKLDFKWKYLLCFIIADTAFLLGGAEMQFYGNLQSQIRECNNKPTMKDVTSHLIARQQLESLPLMSVFRTLLGYENTPHTLGALFETHTNQNQQEL